MARKAPYGQLILVHWHDEEANELAAELRRAGWKVQVGMSVLREVKAHPPTAVVISLRRLPSHGREVTDALWYTKWGRAIPIVFFDGQTDKVESTKAKFPAARFVDWGGLPALLETFVGSGQSPIATGEAKPNAAPDPGGKAGYSDSKQPGRRRARERDR